MMMTLFLCFLIQPTGEIRAIFWNMHSGNSSDDFLAAQMVEKENVDFWGLSEVSNQAALDAFVNALERNNTGMNFVSKLSEDGNQDRLAIIFRADRLTSLPYSGSASVDEIGNNFFEVDSIKVGSSGLRPSLGIQLKTEEGKEFIILVNHWKCCNNGRDRRDRQASATNTFAEETPGMLIIAGGDHNMPLQGSQRESAFRTLTSRWTYVVPQQTDVGTFRSGSILDSAFAINSLGWHLSTSILRRSGNEIATSREFNDTRQTTDHRPLLLSIKPDDGNGGDAFEELKRRMEELEASMAALKKAMEKLERERQ